MRRELLIGEISDFLKCFVYTSNWVEVIWNIEIQPGYLNTHGHVLQADATKTPLRIRPTERIKKVILSLHVNTATSDATKWNRLRLWGTPVYLHPPQFIWDQEWQNEIDRGHLEKQKADPAYQIPKWHWEAEE